MTSNKWDAPEGTSNEWDGTLEDAQALYEGRKKYCDETQGLDIGDDFERHCKRLQGRGTAFLEGRLSSWRRALNPIPPACPVATAAELRQAQDKIEELEKDLAYQVNQTSLGWRTAEGYQKDLKYQSQATEAYRYASKDTAEKDKKIEELERDIRLEKEKSVSMSSSVMWYANRHDEASKAASKLMDAAQEARADLASCKEALRLVRAALRSVGMEEK